MNDHGLAPIAFLIKQLVCRSYLAEFDVVFEVCEGLKGEICVLQYSCDAQRLQGYHRLP